MTAHVVFYPAETVGHKNFPSAYDECPECGQPKKKGAKLCLKCRLGPRMVIKQSDDPTCELNITLPPQYIERFWEKVNKNGPIVRPGLTPCWVWTGCTSPLGYGVITMKPLHILAHRVSWFLEHGVLLCGNKVQLQHHCDNPPCVNPEHLFDGTQMDNVHDCMEKGRFNPGYVCGEQVGNHKLTAEEVLEIREKYDGVREGYAAIGKEYGVDQTNIGYILRRKTWKHI
jgi:hypothetical protein